MNRRSLRSLLPDQGADPEQKPNPLEAFRQSRYPVLSEEGILAWADAHHARTDRWPTAASGVVGASPQEKWVNIDMCLRLGMRGLPGGSSLARLLELHRDVRELPRGAPLSARLESRKT